MRVFCCVLVTLVGLSTVPNVNSQMCLADDIQKNTEFKYKSKNLYKGLTIFTANFLDAMHKANPNDNLFFSPFSLYHALLLAYFGSANQTEKGLKVDLKRKSFKKLVSIVVICRKFFNFTGPTANPTSSKDTNLKSVIEIITAPTHPLNSRQLTVFTLPKTLN